MKLVRGTSIVALVLVELSACSFLVDTNGLSGGSSDAGADSSGDASASDAASDGGSGSDSGTKDAGLPAATTLVQESGTSGTSVTSLTISLPSPGTLGNTFIFAIASSSEVPGEFSGNYTNLKRCAMTGVHIATSVWYAGVENTNDVSIQVIWQSTQPSAAVLLTEWSGTLTQDTDAEGDGTGTDISTPTLSSANQRLLFAGVGMHNHSLTGPNGGFTSIDSVAHDDLQLLTAYRNDGNSSAASWTAVTADGWDSILVSFAAN